MNANEFKIKGKVVQYLDVILDLREAIYQIGIQLGFISKFSDYIVEVHNDKLVRLVDNDHHGGHPYWEVDKILSEDPDMIKLFKSYNEFRKDFLRKELHSNRK